MSRVLKPHDLLSLKARELRRSIASRRLTRDLAASENSDDNPLNGDVILVDIDRAHRFIRRLKADTPVFLSIQLLHGCLVSVDERDYPLTIVRSLALINDPEVAIPNLLVDHRVPTNSQDVV